MPELPEVESVRTALARALPGRRVTDVRGEHVELRRSLDPAALAEHLVGRTFATPQRRAKFLLLPLEEGGRLLVHLGMTGRLVLHDDPDDAAEPHTHLRIALDDGTQLRYVDPRRFGVVTWLAPGATDASLERLGLDPLADDFVQRVVPVLKGRRGAIKNLLMDQSIIGGLGNIYVTEALFRAGIHPKRKGSRTSVARLTELAGHCQEILRAAIDAGGTTLRDYANPDGERGAYVLELLAYGRAGESCPRCGATLKDLKMGNRSTVYCPQCQR